MVRVCRVDATLRSYFTANELSGWPDGISYTVNGPKKRKTRRRYREVAQPVKAVALQIGVPAKSPVLA
jgi:hypothetical protein